MRKCSPYVHSSLYSPFIIAWKSLLIQRITLFRVLKAFSAMLLEEQRFLHEDLERLEQGISDRVAEDPRHVCASDGSETVDYKLTYLRYVTG